MTNPIKGMVAVISNYGVGKTTFALECGYQPKDIVFINDDVKDTGLNEEFKLYIDLVSTSKEMKVLEFHAYCNKLIDNLKPAKVIIWDTWTQYQATFPAYVKSNPNEFRLPTQYSSMGKMKAGELYQDAYRYEGAWLAKLKEKCDLLILTFHLKQEYVNNVAVPGKMKPGHDRAIEKYADLRVWLTPNPDGQVPTGLIMKNISKRDVTKKGIKTQQVLPLRIARCDWENIFNYWEHPVGNRKLADEEKPNSFELSLIEGTLTTEDKRLYEVSLPLVEKQSAEEKAEELMIKQSQEKAIKEWIKENCNGVPAPVAMMQVKAIIESGELVYDGEINMAKINEWSK